MIKVMDKEYNIAYCEILKKECSGEGNCPLKKNCPYIKAEDAIAKTIKEIVKDIRTYLSSLSS